MPVALLIFFNEISSIKDRDAIGADFEIDREKEREVDMKYGQLK